MDNHPILARVVKRLRDRDELMSLLEQVQIKEKARPHPGQDVARRRMIAIVCIVLVASAILKSTDVIDAAVALRVILPSARPWMILVVIQGELGVAFWLLSGWRIAAAWTATVIAFIAFVVVNLMMIWRGVDSCGCFGPLHSSPYFVGALDVLVLSFLIVFYPSERNVSKFVAGRRISYVIGAYLAASALSLSFFVFGSKDLRADMRGVQFSGDNQSILLDYDDGWIGQALPIEPFIKINRDMSKGTWRLVMYRANCPKCTSRIAMYEDLNRRSEYLEGSIALVEVPPYTSSSKISRGVITYGRLDDRYRWYISTPLEICLVDGIVVKIEGAH